MISEYQCIAMWDIMKPMRDTKGRVVEIKMQIIGCFTGEIAYF
jgi:predicted RNA-binding protein